MVNWIRFNPTADETSREQTQQTDEVEEFRRNLENERMDNSLIRQFDSEPGRGFFEASSLTNTNDATESIFGFDWQGEHQENPLLVGPARTAYDYTFEYDQTLNDRSDTEDLPGANLATTWRGAVEAGESASDLAGGPGNLAGLILTGFIAMGALYLLGPLFELLAALLGD